MGPRFPSLSLDSFAFLALGNAFALCAFPFGKGFVLALALAPALGFPFVKVTFAKPVPFFTFTFAFAFAFWQGFPMPKNHNNFFLIGLEKLQT